MAQTNTMLIVTEEGAVELELPAIFRRKKPICERRTREEVTRFCASRGLTWVSYRWK
jgi:hypothetical protein